MKQEEIRQKDEGTFPNLDRFRLVSLKHTKGSKERSYAKALEDAKEQQKDMKRSASMKNLFAWRGSNANNNNNNNRHTNFRRRESIG
jgi:hypothetical protein